MPTPIPRALHGASVDARLETLMGWLRMAAQADYIGEDVSQLGHALQCAALATRQDDPGGRVDLHRALPPRSRCPRPRDPAAD